MTQSINTAVDANALAQALVGPGVTVSNATFSGNASQKGLFTGGLEAGGTDQTGATGIGFDNGVVLSSGNAGQIFDPQTNGRLDTAYGGPGDSDLTAISGANTNDASVLSFDFNAGSATTVYFNFVFSSSEYPDSPSFNDSFGIFLNGTNIATIPGDNSAVALSNFDNSANRQYYKDASVNPNPSNYPTQVINDEIESMSVVIHASATVVPNSTNHIKFAVADSGDDAVDSFVFIQGGSLSTTQVPSGGPAAPSGLALAPGSDSGVSSSDDVTNVAVPTLTGTAGAGNTVSVSLDGTVVGTTTADASGNWSYTVGSALADGVHSFTATAQSGSGPASAASSPLSVTVDTAPPAAPPAPALAPASDSGTLGDDLTNATQPVLTGTAEAGSTVTITDGTGASAVALGTATADASGNWTFTPAAALAEGAHSITATATDAAGNASLASPALALTIDATPPAAPPAPVLAPASDSGVQGDGITNATTPTVTGTAEAGSTVALYDGATQIGTAVAAANGAWSIAVASTLAGGTHQLTAKATDAAGNTSAASPALALTVDTTPPAVTAALASDTGASATDGITSDPTLAGGGDPGATVTVSEGSTTLGTTMADATGHWTFTPTGLADGLHVLTATETDAAGNTDSAQVSLALDTAAPAVTAALLHDTGAFAADGITSDPTLAGGGDPGATVTVSEGSTTLGTTVADATGHWTFTPTGLADGLHVLTATETDAAGNADAASVSLTLATATPAVTAALLHDTGASPTDRVTSDPTLNGTGQPGSTISIATAGGQALGTVTVDGSGHWALAPQGLADGPYTVTVTDTDTAGNAGAAQLSFTLDTATPPIPSGLTLAQASDTGAPGDGITSVTQPTVTGTAAAGDTVTLYDGTTQLGTAVAAADGTWSITSGTALADGTHRLTATARTGAGGVSPASSGFNLTIDTAAPEVTAAATDDPNTPVTRAPLLTGTGDPGASVTVSEGGRSVGTATAGADGTWSFDPVAAGLSTGTHTLVASETDAAGNTGTAPAVSLAVPDARFDLSNVTASTSGSFVGSDYTGPVSQLQAEYDYTGSDSVLLSARVANVFIKAGPGVDALQALAGSNVLDGGTGSNFLVGASGADGGTDTFFTDARGPEVVWNTLVNFHAGDSATLWGFDPSVSTWHWDGISGVAGYTGATLRADVHGTGTTDTSITFAGLSMAQAQGLQVSTGSINNLPYLYLHNPGV